jgi:hypothetical protein
MDEDSLPTLPLALPDQRGRPTNLHGMKSFRRISRGRHSSPATEAFERPASLPSLESPRNAPTANFCAFSLRAAVLPGSARNPRSNPQKLNLAETSMTRLPVLNPA